MAFKTLRSRNMVHRVPSLDVCLSFNIKCTAKNERNMILAREGKDVDKSFGRSISQMTMDDDICRRRSGHNSQSRKDSGA